MPPYQPDETGRKDMRVIGTDTALSVHILEVDPALPADRCTVTWESAGPALYGVFVPVSNAMEEIASSYRLNQPASDLGRFDFQAYPWYAFKALNTLCVEKDACRIYGAPVRDYWRRAEEGMTAGMKDVLARAAALDAEAAAALLTAYCRAVQERAFSDAKALLNDVLWTLSKNSNTMKVGRNPETHEVLDEERVLPPMEVTPDPVGYRPEALLNGWTR